MLEEYKIVFFVIEFGVDKDIFRDFGRFSRVFNNISHVSLSFFRWILSFALANLITDVKRSIRKAINDIAIMPATGKKKIATLKRGSE